MSKSDEIVVYDDWNVRDQTHYNSICNTYKFLIYMCLFSTFIVIASLVYMLFAYIDVWFAVVPVLALFIIADVEIYFKWLKVKKNHLVIKSSSIEITNLFNKTKEYIVNYKECELVLKPTFQRNNGIRLTFIDTNGRKVCTYVYMINKGSLLGFPLNDWEKALKSLGIRLIDKGYIFKNNI